MCLLATSRQISASFAGSKPGKLPRPPERSAQGAAFLASASAPKTSSPGFHLRGSNIALFHGLFGHRVFFSSSFSLVLLQVSLRATYLGPRCTWFFWRFVAAAFKQFFSAPAARHGGSHVMAAPDQMRTTGQPGEASYPQPPRLDYELRCQYFVRIFHLVYCTT